MSSLVICMGADFVNLEIRAALLESGKRQIQGSMSVNR